MQKNEKFSLRTQKTTFECGRANMMRAEDSKHNFKFRWPNSYLEIPLGKPRRRPPFSALAVRHEIQVTFKLEKVGASLGKVCACLHHMLYIVLLLFWNSLFLPLLWTNKSELSLFLKFGSTFELHFVHWA